MIKQEKSQERIAELRAMPYTEYLHTQEWRSKRIAAILHAERRCQLCNSPQDLNVHHRSYERLGNERLVDLLVLCRACHTLFHEQRNLFQDLDECTCSVCSSQG